MLPETFGATFIWWMAAVALLIVVCSFLFVKFRRFLRRPELLGTSREDLKKKWAQIEEMAQRGDEMSLRVSVMEADKLLDHVLKNMGFGGVTMAERLKLVVYKYPRVRRAWQGHGIRNRLAHETSYHLSRSIARQALSSFRDALKELGII